MSRRERRATGRLAVLVNEFPSTSETFILREIQELLQRGFDLRIFALKQEETGTVHQAAEALKERTYYRCRPLSFASLGRQILAFLKHPVGVVNAYWMVLRFILKQPRATRELVSALWAANDYVGARQAIHRVEHLHAQFLSMPATVAVLLAEILGVTLSISCHARDIFTNDSIFPGEKLAEAEFVTVCTHHGLDRLQRLYPLAGGNRLHLLYHGLDPLKFMPVRNVKNEQRMVLAVGRLVEKKGFDILLRAAALARANGAEFKLHIVGDGPEREDLERMTMGLGLRDCVVFEGTLSQEQLLPLYQQATAFAMASIITDDGDRDGIPNVLIEALAMELPTVATSVGGIPELIEHEVTGLLAQPGDAESLAQGLERVLYDEELRAAVKQAGRQKVAVDFDIQRNVGELAKLFEPYVRPVLNIADEG